MSEMIEVDPKVNANFIVVGLGKAASLKQDGEVTVLPYRGLVWMLFNPKAKPFMVVPLPRQYWLGLN